MSTYDLDTFSNQLVTRPAELVQIGDIVEYNVHITYFFTSIYHES